MQSLEQDLRHFASERHVASFGVASLESLPDVPAPPCPDVLTGFTRAVVIGVKLPDAVLEGIVDRPTALYFHTYRQANYLLDRVAFELALMLEERGFKALAVPASMVVSHRPMLGHLSHRFLGRLAGLGFIGRSSLLVAPRFGTRMRYASILTDAPLPAGSATEDTCGACRACVDLCPARAISATAQDFDLAACYAKLSEFNRLPGISQHVCGVCVKACPGQQRKG